VYAVFKIKGSSILAYVNLVTVFALPHNKMLPDPHFNHKEATEEKAKARNIEGAMYNTITKPVLGWKGRSAQS
jgi:hypothetical protein